MNKEELYSYHVFLFPFQWYYTGKSYANKTLEEKTELNKFVGLLKNTRWKRQGFKLDTILNYNEYNYFYDFVRDVLYDRNSKDEAGYIANFYYDLEPDTFEYRFKVSWYESGQIIYKEYRLSIESILLHLYRTGVGVISFHLNNRLPEQASPDDILRINQYGRRLYPPFFGLDKELTGKVKQYQPGGFSNGLKITQQKELPQWITIGSDQNLEDFSRYTDPRYFEKNPFQLPRFVKNLFNEFKLTTNPEERHTLEDGIFVSPLLDDRMFVVCWYGNDDLAEKLKPKGSNSSETLYPHLTDDWWYKFIFVDTNFPMCQNEMMKKQLLHAHTNARWAEFGTFYGISRYSFVCLTYSLESLKNSNAQFLVNHIQTMYYKLAELCLVQRACVLRFSAEVSEISALDKKEKKYLTRNVSNLYKQYLQFVNKIYFKEVTAQEQGIELYDMLQEKMRISEQVTGLEAEIEKLYQFVNIREQSAQTTEMNLLNKIATYLLPPTLIAAFFGVNFVDREWVAGFSSKLYWPFWYIVIVAIVFTLVFIIFFAPLSRKRLRKIE